MQVNEDLVKNEKSLKKKTTRKNTMEVAIPNLLSCLYLIQ